MGHKRWKQKGIYKVRGVTRRGWDGDASPKRQTRQQLKRELQNKQ